VSRHERSDALSEERSDQVATDLPVAVIGTKLVADIVHQAGELKLDVQRTAPGQAMGALQTVVKLGQPADVF
jgi:hypothetical protein